MTFHLTRGHIKFSSVWVVECTVATIWEIATHSVDRILTICNLVNFSYFTFWFLGLDLGSGCFSSWSLHTFYFKA